MIKEGIIKNVEGRLTPDSKYYAFDWDDNIVHMPTKILVKSDDGETVEMSTQDFEIHKKKIGRVPFRYKGKMIVGPDENFLINFSTSKDDDFIPHSEIAEPGPSFDDFREAINNGSIFSIITARGNNPETIKEAIYNYIISDFNGISKDSLIKSLRQYRRIAGISEKMSPINLIRWYLDLNKYYAVAYGNPNVDVPQAKVAALRDFKNYVMRIAKKLGNRVFFKNKISDKFNPYDIRIGFSDDSETNAMTMKKKIDDPNVDVYFTGRGFKEKLD